MIERVPIDSLTLDPSNARKHSKKNLEAIKGSLARFGQQKPIVVSEAGVVIAGNGTLEAARSLGWREIDIKRSSLKGSDITAYAVADNRAGELADWNLDVLPGTLEALGQEFDLGEIGFDANDLAKLTKKAAKAGMIDDEHVPEAGETRCKLGDLWQLGPHRLVCGDSSDPLVIERLMGEERADIVFTDPPYDLPENDFHTPLLQATRDAHIFVMHDDRGMVEYLKGSPFAFDRFYVCDFVFSSPRGNDPYLRHILISQERHGNARKHANLGDGFSSIIKIDYRGNLKDEQTGHKHQKPVWLIEKFLQHWGSELCLDLFAGSGSTLIAAEKSSKRCYCVELDPRHCDRILARYEQFTGQRANLIVAAYTGDNSDGA